jgi:ribosomal protein S18 acetylase RimI-like enzyme
LKDSWLGYWTMSGFKFLIDTNIVIGLEDNHQVDSSLAELARRCATHHVRLFVDGAVDDDVRRDNDLARKAITLSKLERFKRLSGVQYPPDEVLARSFGMIGSDNDRSDARLLYCLELKAADFLITRDARLHRRARRCSLGPRVLSVEEAVQWLRQTFEPKHVELPYIAERPAYAVDRQDPLFESLRADYHPNFDAWFEKCAQEHRPCWVVEVSGEMAGIVIRKDELRHESPVTLPGHRILKICTFKMAERFRGEKFGEQLLKQCLWYAQANEYHVIYLTAFADKEELLSLLRSYGFVQTSRQSNGEFVVEKALHHGAIQPGPQEDLLEFNRKCYPRFYDGDRAAKYCVPIRGPYHQKLFPEISFRPQLPLFSGSDIPRELAATRRQERLPGNTIRKVYICRAQSKGLRPGDLLFFYLSKDDRLDASQSITTVGVVEAVRDCADADDLIRMTAKRSVFSIEELRGIQAEAPTPVKVIDFLLVSHLQPSVALRNLVDTGVFNGRPPQSISKLDRSRYEKLRSLMGCKA